MAIIQVLGKILINMNTPSLKETIDTLNSVYKDHISREEAASWAFNIIKNDDIDIENEYLWDLLDIISGIDTKESLESDYFHSKEQIEEWIEYYKNVEKQTK